MDIMRNCSTIYLSILILNFFILDFNFGIYFINNIIISNNTFYNLFFTIKEVVKEVLLV